MSDSQASQRRPLRLLALDGGGIRGLSELTMLDEIMRRIAHQTGADPKTIRPCDYFDIIGGTSTGGIIAVLLAKLQLTTKDCIKIYRGLSEEIFSKSLLWTRSKLEMFIHNQFDANILKEVIQKEVVKILLHSPNPSETESAKSPEEKAEALAEALLLDPFITSDTQTCRAFVCATPGKQPRKGAPVLLRTYEHRDVESVPDAKIWEALRATSAAPFFFDPIKIGDKEYVDGGLGCNNPAEQVYNEALTYFTRGEVLPEIGCVLSLGTGMPKVLPEMDNKQTNPAGYGPLVLLIWIVKKVFPLDTDALDVLGRIATECENVHKTMLKKTELQGKYFRFNVQQGLQDISLEKYEQLVEVRELTEGYLGEYEVAKRLDKVVNKLSKLSSNNPDDWRSKL